MSNTYVIPCHVPCFSALDKIVVTGYKALGLVYFFTAGPDEVKAWTIQVSAVVQIYDLIKLGRKSLICCVLVTLPMKKLTFDLLWWTKRNDCIISLV